MRDTFKCIIKEHQVICAFYLFVSVIIRDSHPNLIVIFIVSNLLFCVSEGTICFTDTLSVSTFIKVSPCNAHGLLILPGGTRSAVQFLWGTSFFHPPMTLVFLITLYFE